MVYHVKLIILLMGRTCSQCKQHFSCNVRAESYEDAVLKAKAKSGADPDYNKFLIASVKEL